MRSVISGELIPVMDAVFPAAYRGPAPVTGRATMRAAEPSTRPVRRLPGRLVTSWLLLCAVATLGLAGLGGATRLAGAGLSIVEWEPVGGVLPPLGREAWDEAFAAYRETPEFRVRNASMDLPGFRRIYYIEYFHRLLARGVGLLVVVPGLVFFWRGWLSRREALRIGILVGLGGLQGALGWWMVASGLVDRPHVDPLRLATHLLVGAAIFAGFVREATLRVRTPRDEARPSTRLVAGLGLALAAALGSGALMAGTGAGHALRSFPFFPGGLWPRDLPGADAGWRAFLASAAAIHVLHRGAVLLVAGLVLVAGRADRRSARSPVPWLGLASLLGLQIALGGVALVLGVPRFLASLHQLGGFLVVAAWVVWAWLPAGRAR